MRAYLKTVLAVAGGVAGVGGGAVALALRKTGKYGETAGGGDTSLSSLSSVGADQGTTVPDSTVDTVASVSESTQSSTQDTESLVASPLAESEEQSIDPKVPVKEEKKNCAVVDFPRLNDIFEYIIGDGAYTLVSCTKTNKDTDTSDKFSNQWKGLFPSDLFSGTVKEFQLTTETTVLGENITTVFSSESLFPTPVTGKWDDSIFQAKEEGETFQVKEIDLEGPKSGKIFFFLTGNIESLRQQRLSYGFNSLE